ncbi:hypothetical protein B0H21DRAFT_769902 [Amylocystis lapponica]|nr:hypothetical protein B0H21DRAFT_769902 [Amylocystis lapponica]
MLYTMLLQCPILTCHFCSLILNMTTLSALVFYLYDVILTFLDEIQLIWRRKFSIATVVFLLNHYATLAYLITIVLFVFPWPNQRHATNINCQCCSHLEPSQLPCHKWVYVTLGCDMWCNSYSVLSTSNICYIEQVHSTISCYTVFGASYLVS